MRFYYKLCNSYNREHNDDDAENIDITMPMYNLIEYSGNYSGTSGSLWHFKRDESPITDARDPDNVSATNLSSFKYKLSILRKPAADRVLENVKIAVPLKYLSNFWRY